MQDMKNAKICQSCGMPIEDVQTRGTEANGAKSEDYCQYCYDAGAFKADMTMQEMIDFCAPVWVKEGVTPTEDAARQAMQSFFPQLKRWQV